MRIDHTFVVEVEASESDPISTCEVHQCHNQATVVLTPTGPGGVALPQIGVCEQCYRTLADN